MLVSMICYKKKYWPISIVQEEKECNIYTIEIGSKAAIDKIKEDKSAPLTVYA